MRAQPDDAADDERRRCAARRLAQGLEQFGNRP
jgi:hypothetical protein